MIWHTGNNVSSSSNSWKLVTTKLYYIILSSYVVVLKQKTKYSVTHNRHIYTTRPVLGCDIDMTTKTTVPSQIPTLLVQQTLKTRTQLPPCQAPYFLQLWEPQTSPSLSQYHHRSPDPTMTNTCTTITWYHYHPTLLACNPSKEGTLIICTLLTAWFNLCEFTRTCCSFLQLHTL